MSIDTWGIIINFLKYYLTFLIINFQLLELAIFIV